jgi:hypothetical protein
MLAVVVAVKSLVIIFAALVLIIGCVESTRFKLSDEPGMGGGARVWGE